MPCEPWSPCATREGENLPNLPHQFIPREASRTLGRPLPAMRCVYPGRVACHQSSVNPRPHDIDGHAAAGKATEPPGAARRPMASCGKIKKVPRHLRSQTSVHFAGRKDSMTTTWSSFQRLRPCCLVAVRDNLREMASEPAAVARTCSEGVLTCLRRLIAHYKNTCKRNYLGNFKVGNIFRRSSLPPFGLKIDSSPASPRGDPRRSRRQHADPLLVPRCSDD